MKGLYLVTPDWDDTGKLLDVTEAALAGSAAVVQYRNKFASPELRRVQAERVMNLCHSYRRPLIINDFVELCLEIGADGVHVGGTDAPVAQVRAALGPDKVIGASCYGDAQLARNAYQAGATYVAFGGFYPSRVKKYPVTTPLSIIAETKREVPLPVCVIGGMTAENAAPLVAAGADLVAAISSVYLADDPTAAARGIARLFGED